RLAEQRGREIVGVLGHSPMFCRRGAQRWKKGADRGRFVVVPSENCGATVHPPTNGAEIRRHARCYRIDSP
ncbi:MAG TPA: hypothetical protein VF945_18205, partial [Polyangia bacterium]